MYTNADTVTNKLTELKGLIEIHTPEIIAITEVKQELKAQYNKSTVKTRELYNAKQWQMP